MCFFCLKMTLNNKQGKNGSIKVWPIFDGFECPLDPSFVLIVHCL